MSRTRVRSRPSTAGTASNVAVKSSRMSLPLLSPTGLDITVTALDIPLPALSAFFQGALSVIPVPGGVVPWRLPERLLAQAPDDMTPELFRMCSGVRLEFTTQASALEIDVSVSRLAIASVGSATNLVTFEIVMDGAVLRRQSVSDISDRIFTFDGEFLSQTTQRRVTLRFEDLPRGEKDLQLWFPPNGVVTVFALRADAPMTASQGSHARWLHYGSSISHGADAGSPTQTWPAVAARLAGASLLNLGVAGGCHLDQFAARAIRYASAEFISLKIGINTACFDAFKHRTFGPALHGFLDTIRDGHPTVPILVVSPIICPMLEDIPGPIMRDANGVFSVQSAGVAAGKYALSLRHIREVIASIAAVRATYDSNLFYLDGLSLFGHADAIDLYDGVHPTPNGYTRIGQRFAEAAFAADGPFGKHSRDHM
jgi:GDSL-like Lipase/Acylhydrolase family